MNMIAVMVVASLAILIGVPIIWIPAMLALKQAARPGIEDLDLDEAIERIRSKTLPPMQVALEVRRTIVTRMKNFRRISCDSCRTAFRRGYGYCIQQARAMAYMLNALGIRATVNAIRYYSTGSDTDWAGSRKWNR